MGRSRAGGRRLSPSFPVQLPAQADAKALSRLRRRGSTGRDGARGPFIGGWQRRRARPPPGQDTWAREAFPGGVLCGGAMEAGAMEARERSTRERGSAAAAAGNGGGGLALTGQSYWLDIWLMLLIDLLLFVFVYLLP